MADEVLEYEILELKKNIQGINADLVMMKELNGQLIAWRKEFIKDNGYVPKIIKQVEKKFETAFALHKKEITKEISLIPCKTISGEFLKAKCRISDINEYLDENEKAIKGRKK